MSALFLCWRIGLTLVTFVGSQTVPLVANGGPGAIGEGKSFDYWTSWAQWDGGWFLLIARDGYVLLPGEVEYRSVAFFPLYPLLTRVMSYPFGDHLVFFGLLISHLAFLGFLIVLFGLVKSRFDHDVALTSTVTVLLFPTAYFGVAFYSEALFLFLAILSLHFLDRDRIVAGSAFAGLAAATRLVGMAAWIPLAVWAFKNWEWRKWSLVRLVLGALVALIPLGLYCAYLQATFGDPFYFIHVGSEWYREPSNPWTTIIQQIRSSPADPFQHYLELGSTFLFAGVLVAGARKIPFEWWIFSLVAFLIPVSSGLLFSMPRYVLLSIGAFIILGRFLHDKPLLKVSVWSASLVLQCVLSVRFINGYWAS